MDNSRYVYKAGKMLRTGYTTGSCAAAAAKAAALMLFNNEYIESISIDTPKGIVLNLDIKNIEKNNDYISCCVIKDAGDDPDITDGIEVYAKASKTLKVGVCVKGGRGVGIVTRDGLYVECGKSAINPVPMKMIIEEVNKVLPSGQGVEIEIYVPAGEEIAKKTFNPKLGIVGGISILGTSGIVEPMSEEALKDTIALELKSRIANGKNRVILVPGNYGEEFTCSRVGADKADIIQVSNYLGFALEKCAELGYKSIILSGHIGKLIKPAGGIFYTHSRVSDTRMEILTAYLAITGMQRELLNEIMSSKTTEEAMKIVDNNGYDGIYNTIAQKCAQRCEEYVFGNIEVGVILFSMKELLAMSDKTKRLLEELYG